MTHHHHAQAPPPLRALPSSPHAPTFMYVSGRPRFMSSPLSALPTCRGRPPAFVHVSCGSHATIPFRLSVTGNTDFVSSG